MKQNTGLKQTLISAKGHEKEDSYAKNIFSRKEFLSVILKNVVSEYRDIPKEKIMSLIEGDTIAVGTEEVSMDARNTIRGENTESSAEEEALSKYDVHFRSMLPNSDIQMVVNLHIDLEIQDKYSPGYPIIKRAVYYASRAISKQLRIVTDKEIGYKNLEKVYSIWLCLEEIPKKLQNTISYYKLENYKNESFGREITFPEDSDSNLMEIVLIRLGESPIEENELMDTLHGIFSGNATQALKHIPQMPESEEKEVVDMLMMSSYSEKRGQKKGEKIGEKIGMVLSIKISRAIASHPSWTDEQIAEHCSCSLESVKNYKEALASV